MAKPIRATPELKGADAIRFAEKRYLADRQPISKTDKKIAERIFRNWKTFDAIQQ
ncbi:hypothetical protein HZB89_00195 [archaeon]|nr:hypothetical protein [archaeon]